MQDTMVLKVYVDSLGTVLADGSPVSLATLDSRLQVVQENQGLVSYSRHNVHGDPPPGAMEVIALIIKHHLPIQVFLDETFETSPVLGGE